MYSSKKRTPVTDDGTYNGYKNWNTWLVHLFLTSEEPTYLLLEYLAETSKDVREMADKAKQYILNHNPLHGQPGLYHNLLASALNEVEWTEAVQFVWDVYHERHASDDTAGKPPKDAPDTPPDNRQKPPDEPQDTPEAPTSNEHSDEECF